MRLSPVYSRPLPPPPRPPRPSVAKGEGRDPSSVENKGIQLSSGLTGHLADPRGPIQAGVVNAPGVFTTWITGPKRNEFEGSERSRSSEDLRAHCSLPWCHEEVLRIGNGSELWTDKTTLNHQFCPLYPSSGSCLSSKPLPPPQKDGNHATGTGQPKGYDLPSSTSIMDSSSLHARAGRIWTKSILTSNKAVALLSALKSPGEDRGKSVGQYRRTSMAKIMEECRPESANTAERKSMRALSTLPDDLKVQQEDERDQKAKTIREDMSTSFAPSKSPLSPPDSLEISTCSLDARILHPTETCGFHIPLPNHDPLSRAPPNTDSISHLFCTLTGSLASDLDCSFSRHSSLSSSARRRGRFWPQPLEPHRRRSHSAPNILSPPLSRSSTSPHARASTATFFSAVSGSSIPDSIVTPCSVRPRRHSFHPSVHSAPLSSPNRDSFCSIDKEPVPPETQPSQTAPAPLRLINFYEHPHVARRSASSFADGLMELRMSGVDWDNRASGGYGTVEILPPPAFSHPKVSSGCSRTGADPNYTPVYSSAVYDDVQSTPFDEHPSTSTHPRSTLSRLSTSHCDEVGSGYGSVSDHGPTSSELIFRMESLESELRRVSAELAFSIRREMELEDELARSRDALELAQPSAREEKRGSDYYSDVDAPARFPISDVDATIEQLERDRRVAEQDRARIQLELSQRLQQEVDARRQAEDRVTETISRVDQLRRQLSAERAVKESFEGLMTGMRGELEHLGGQLSTMTKRAQQAEQQLQEFSKMQDQALEMEQKIVTFQEQARANSASIKNLQDKLLLMQEEYEAKIAQIKAETVTTISTSAQGSAVVANHQEGVAELPPCPFRTAQEFRSIFPPPPDVPQGDTLSSSMGRSMSVVTRRPPSTASRRQTGPLSRSGSVQEQGRNGACLSIIPPTGFNWSAGPGSAVPGGSTERLQHVEEQRDALRATVRTLRQRLSHQTEQHAKEMRRMVQQMNEAVASAGLIASLDLKDGLSIKLSSNSACPPTLAASVAHLRQEMQILRRRADDLLDQKWRCEKGLGGLKMDLDRVRQDADTLQVMLGKGQQHMNDILVDGGQTASTPLRSDPVLDNLCTTLQAAFLLTLGYLDLQNPDTELSGFAPSELLAALKDCFYGSEAARRVALAESQCLSSLLTRPQAILSLAFSDSYVALIHSIASRLAFFHSEAESQSHAVAEILTSVAAAANHSLENHQLSTQALAATEARLRELEEYLISALNQAESVLATYEDDVRTLMDTQDIRVLRIERTPLLPFGDNPVTTTKESRAESDGKSKLIGIAQRKLAGKVGSVDDSGVGFNDDVQSPNTGAGTSISARPKSQDLMKSSSVIPVSHLFRSPKQSPSNSSLLAGSGASMSPSSSPSSSLASLSPRPRRNMSVFRSIDDAAGIDRLTNTLDDLELALQSADEQMSKVVGWMNAAQVQVERLQTEREGLNAKTAKLLNEFERERDVWKGKVWDF